MRVGPRAPRRPRARRPPGRAAGRWSRPRARLSLAAAGALCAQAIAFGGLLGGDSGLRRRPSANGPAPGWLRGDGPEMVRHRLTSPCTKSTEQGPSGGAIGGVWGPPAPKTGVLPGKVPCFRVYIIIVLRHAPRAHARWVSDTGLSRARAHGDVTHRAAQASRARARMGMSDIEPTAPSAPPPPTADACLLYTSPSPRDGLLSRMPSSA